MCSSETYRIREIYDLTYEEKYETTPPHIEDVAVYSHKLIEVITEDKFSSIINKLAISVNHISALFENKLCWKNGKGFIEEDQVPNGSVIIVKLNHKLTLSGKHFEYFDQQKYALYQVKFVGDVNLTEPCVLPAGTPLRFSLARFWDGYNTPQKLDQQIRTH